MSRYRPASRYRPSDLTDTQKAAILEVIDTGGQKDVISSLYQRRTVRALHRKHLVTSVWLEFKEGKRLWYQLSVDGLIMREDLQDYMAKRKANRR